jgi:anti-sigma regulatory factor (Ser/Thr protein kinase)
MIVGLTSTYDQEGFLMLTRSAAEIHDLTRAMPERVHLELGALTLAVPTARTWARVIMSGWGLARLAGDGALVLSELVTNSLVHAPGRAVGIWLLTDRERLVIMVGDQSPDMPVRAQAPDAGEPSGRGLVIVNALAEQWGAYRVPTGKIVWAVLT